MRLDGHPVDMAVVERMSERVAHRGPDGCGTWHADGIAFGHRRLAIIDLDSGGQPMTCDGGRFAITYNGELYNFREIRREMEALGDRFTTASDTEVVLRAYVRWGRDCVDRFRGMFAFAVADRRAGTVFLARDHFGIKPLVWAHHGNTFAFASEIQALREVPGLPLEVSAQAVDDYLRLQYIPAPETVFRHVFKLPPGHCMTVGPSNAAPVVQRYWRFEYRPASSTGRADGWYEGLDAVIADSVGAHMVSDVPFGGFLSGGLDSSLVVSHMARCSDDPVKTFTIGFAESEFDERVYADQVSRRWTTDHSEEIVVPSALEVLPDLVKHHGEPFGDCSCVPSHYLCRMARQHVPMVLSGDAGDELFTGYRSYEAWWRWLKFGGTKRWKRTLYPWVSRVAPARYPARGPTARNWIRFVQLTDERERRSLWPPRVWNSLRNGPPPAVVDNFDATLSPLRRAQRSDFGTYLPDSILTKIDIASMRWGLEVRTPLLDRRVVDYVATMPEEVVARADENGDLVGKLPLKAILRRHYGDRFADRPKQGFTPPFAAWLGPGGSLRDAVSRRILARESPLRDVFDPKGLGAAVNNADHQLIWLLLVLDEWFRQHRSG